MKKLLAVLMCAILMPCVSFAAGVSSQELTKGLEQAVSAAEQEKAQPRAAADWERFDRVSTYLKQAVTKLRYPQHYKEAFKDAFKQEVADILFTYTEANPEAELQDADIAALAEYMEVCVGLKEMIRKADNPDDKENFAAQWFYSQDVPGKYFALQAVNPALATATHAFAKTFMVTVYFGVPFAYMPKEDIDTLNAFMEAIGFHI